MSKRAKARERVKRLQSKSQSRNSKRRTKYASLAGTSRVPTLADASKTNGDDTGTKSHRSGMTNVQKKRLAQGKDPKGALGGRDTLYHSSFGSRTFGSLWF